MERTPRKLSLPSAALRGRWDAAYMRAAQPSTQVDVSVMRDEDDGYLRGTAETHETIAMQFAEQFLAQLDGVEGASGWRRRPSALRYHLAQCPLELVPALQADAQELLGAACNAACSSLGRTTQPLQTNLWFAIGATTSGLHYDAYDNLLLLLRGRKNVLLLPPSASAELAPRPAHGASANHSQLGAAELASLVASAPTPPLTFELLPGEALFIPEGWWHEVESPEEVTLGINYWWDGPSAALLPTAATAAAAAIRCCSRILRGCSAFAGVAIIVAVIIGVSYWWAARVNTGLLMRVRLRVSWFAILVAVRLSVFGRSRPAWR